MENENFRIFNEYGEEIDGIVSRIKNKIIMFGNSPRGRGYQVLYFLREMERFMNLLIGD